LDRAKRSTGDLPASFCARSARDPVGNEEKRMRRPRILIPAIIVLFIDIMLWVCFLPSSTLLNTPCKVSNQINVIGLLAATGLLISIFAGNNWLRKISGILLILTHLVLIELAYVFIKLDHFEMAYLIAGISSLVIIVTVAMLFWPPIVAFFEYRADK
jgi:hypothetical protein